MGSRFGPQGAAIGFALGFLLISGTVSTGCINRRWEALPAGLMSFPIAIELSVDQRYRRQSPEYLYVTSSNFGLQYNSGNVQSYDLEKVVEAINTGCISAWRDPECLKERLSGGRQRSGVCVRPGDGHQLRARPTGNSPEVPRNETSRVTSTIPSARASRSPLPIPATGPETSAWPSPLTAARSSRPASNSATLGRR